MVYIRNIFRIIVALIISFFITEFLVFKIAGYPRWGVEKQVYGIKPYGKKIFEIFKPHSEYANFENGYNVFKRNNLGLTGIDVDTVINNKFIFLLGDSYTEAAQLPPEKIACSVFQNKISQYKYSVLNLAVGGADPYFMYYQSIFYSFRFKPDYVYLIVTYSYKKWLESRYDSIRMEIPNDFGKEKHSWIFARQELFLCNNNSFLNLLDLAFKTSNKINEQPQEINRVKTNDISQKLYDCLMCYRNTYGNKFILVSISSDNSFNDKLSKYCDKNNIIFFEKSIDKRDNKIQNSGHLNEIGNEVFGCFLYDVFNKTALIPNEHFQEK